MRILLNVIFFLVVGMGFVCCQDATNQNDNRKKPEQATMRQVVDEIQPMVVRSDEYLFISPHARMHFGGAGIVEIYIIPGLESEAYHWSTSLYLILDKNKFESVRKKCIDLTTKAREAKISMYKSVNAYWYVSLYKKHPKGSPPNIRLTTANYPILSKPDKQILLDSVEPWQREVLKEFMDGVKIGYYKKNPPFKKNDVGNKLLKKMFPETNK